MRNNLIDEALRLYDKHKKTTYNRKVTVVTFLFKNNKLVYSGLNSEKTDPVQNKYRIKSGYCFQNKNFIDKVHSEITALKKYPSINKWKQKINYNDYTIIIISRMADGTLRNTKPCEVCSEALKAYKGLTVIYYDEKFKNKKIK